LGRLDSTRTPGLHKWLARGVLSCARGCRLLYLLSAEGDNNRFPYKDDAHVEKWVIDSLEVESEHSPLKAPPARIIGTEPCRSSSRSDFRKRG
jgi:hypothetical protein